MTKIEWDSFMKDTADVRMGLFKNFTESNRQRRLAPSIDRIDSNLGYLPSNCQWLTLSQNSARRRKAGAG